MRTFLSIVAVVVVLVLARLSFYSVDASEYAYVTQLGQHLVTYDGGADGAGLHAGWPWPIQLVIRLDRRLQSFDLPGTELLTHDPEGKTIDKTLTVEAFVCWRIADADGVDRFIRRMGTTERARSILGQRINSQLGADIGRMKMDDLISTEPGSKPGRTRVDENMDALQQKLLKDVQALVEADGIELVDIRLRRFNHPARVRDAIFDRIRSERNKKVAYFQSEGEKQARNIESTAEEKVRTLLAEARFQEEKKLKGDADTEAVRIRNQAHSQDPEFYTFLKKLEKLQNILGDNKTVLLLSSHRPMFDLLFQPPRPGVTAGNNGGTGLQPASKENGPKNGATK